MQLDKARISLQKSIAVLPFVNMSSDFENEYFRNGITEEIINEYYNSYRLNTFKQKALDPTNSYLTLRLFLIVFLRRWKELLRRLG